MCVCSGLNEHGPHRHIFWFLVRRTIREGFGELEVFHWGHVLKFQSPVIPSQFSALWLSLQLLLQCHACLSATTTPPNNNCKPQ